MPTIDDAEARLVAERGRRMEEYVKYKAANKALDLGITAMKASVEDNQGGRLKRLLRLLLNQPFPVDVSKGPAAYPIGYPWHANVYTEQGWGTTWSSSSTPEASPTERIRLRGHEWISPARVISEIAVQSPLKSGEIYSHGVINSSSEKDLSSLYPIPRVGIRGVGDLVPTLTHIKKGELDHFFFYSSGNHAAPDSPAANFLYDVIEDIAGQLQK